MRSQGGGDQGGGAGGGASETLREGSHGPLARTGDLFICARDE
jgi:hypothetical protein